MNDVPLCVWYDKGVMDGHDWTDEGRCRRTKRSGMCLYMWNDQPECPTYFATKEEFVARRLMGEL